MMHSIGCNFKGIIAEGLHILFSKQVQTQGRPHIGALYGIIAAVPNTSLQLDCTFPS